MAVEARMKTVGGSQMGWGAFSFVGEVMHG